MNLRMEIVQKHGRKIQQKKKLRKKMKEKKSKKWKRKKNSTKVGMRKEERKKENLHYRNVNKGVKSHFFPKMQILKRPREKMYFFRLNGDPRGSGREGEIQFSIGSHFSHFFLSTYIALHLLYWQLLP